MHTLDTSVEEKITRRTTGAKGNNFVRVMTSYNIQLSLAILRYFGVSLAFSGYILISMYIFGYFGVYLAISDYFRQSWLIINQINEACSNFNKLEPA